MNGPIRRTEWRPEVLAIRAISCVLLTLVLIWINTLRPAAIKIAIGLWFSIAIAVLYSLDHMRIAKTSSALLDRLRERFMLFRARRDALRIVRQSNEIKRAPVVNSLFGAASIRRECLNTFLKDSHYRSITDNTVVLVEQCEDNPLPILLFAENLKNIGLKVYVVVEKLWLLRQENAMRESNRRFVFIYWRPDHDLGRIFNTYILNPEGRTHVEISLAALAKADSKLIPSMTAGDFDNPDLPSNLNSYVGRVAREALALLAPEFHVTSDEHFLLNTKRKIKLGDEE